MSKVAVLGCGPSGMLAAWAAHTHGHDVSIIAPGEKSVISGAQYLHDEIPGLVAIPFDINYEKFGRREGYALKVYGSSDADCSWDSFDAGKHLAWSMQNVYELAWTALASYIVPREVRQRDLKAISASHDLVLSTIPRPTLCTKSSHSFDGQPVWIASHPPQFWNGEINENTIMYNGLGGDPWYRMSRIQGVVNTEYAQQTPHATKLIKPLRTDCDCNPGITFLGRYGKWKKSVLAHHAYWETVYALQ